MCLTHRQVRSQVCGFTKIGVEVLALSGDGALELHRFKLERVMGIEPTPEAWEAAVLPLNYTRRLKLNNHYTRSANINSKPIKHD